MKKIVIVGHPHSGYQDVESLLNACGMTAARPSRREGFSPAEIGDILTKAHAIPPLSQLGEGRSIKQIEPNPVWHGMALDLMLGNLEQDVWGWADPQAVFLLNYWRDLDPQITFMLVYGKPHSVLTRLGADEAVRLSAEALHERVGNWVAYNAALLHFFHRNPQRCLLVHSEQVRESVGSYLQQVRARIDAPWSEHMEQLLAPGLGKNHDTSEAARSQAGVDSSISGVPLSILETFAPAEKEPKRVPHENALVQFLADALIQQNTLALQMYEELQAVANLPLTESAFAAYTAMQAWLAMAGQEQRLSNAESLVSEKERLIENLAQSQAAAEQLARERERMIKQQARAHEALQQAKRDSLQENELLLTQLHQVQEELEGHFMERQQLEKVNKHLAAGNEQAKAQALQLKAKLQTAETKAAAVPALAIANGNSALEQENELLLAQLHQVQEELERFYFENQALKSSPIRVVSPSKAKGAMPVHYGAADRVKRQLSYRLGATMIQQSRSFIGWMAMPFALLREVRNFRSQAALRVNQKLPPIKCYRDAEEAEKVKQHLSYRLGSTMIANARSPIGWVKLPWVLLRETNDFRNRRRDLLLNAKGYPKLMSQ